jgi:hypothetical protein
MAIDKKARVIARVMGEARDEDARTPVDCSLRDAPALLVLRSSSDTETLPLQRSGVPGGFRRRIEHLLG